MKGDVEKEVLAYVLAKQIKELNHQKNAYRCVLQLIKDSGFPNDRECLTVDELINDALASPDIRKKSDEEYDFLAKWLPPIPEVDLQKAQQKWLEEWKPEKETLN